MVEIICPDCDAKSKFRKKELPLYARVECENCGVLLQVIDEDPIEVEVVEDYVSSDDDDYDDEDEDGEL